MKIVCLSSKTWALFFCVSYIFLSAAYAKPSPSWRDYNTSEYSLKFPSSLVAKDTGIFLANDPKAMPLFEKIKIFRLSTGTPWATEYDTGCTDEINLQSISGYKVEAHCMDLSDMGSQHVTSSYYLDRNGVSWGFELSVLYKSGIPSEDKDGERLKIDQEFATEKKQYLSLFHKMLATFKFKN